MKYRFSYKLFGEPERSFVEDVANPLQLISCFNSDLAMFSSMVVPDQFLKQTIIDYLKVERID